MFSIPDQKLEYRSDVDFSNISTILLIDKSVKNYKVFVDSVNSSTLAIVYSGSSSKEELLALLKTNFSTIKRIGICFASDVDNPNIFLDRKPLFLNNEELPYSENVTWIINIINEFNVKNVDFLACNTLEYSNWNNYYDILQKNTGVIVGASNDKTGNLKYGGDWVMESTSQDVEIVYFTKSIEYYTYLLDVTNNWSTGYDFMFGLLTCDNNYLYIPNRGTNSVARTSLTDGTSVNYTWATGLNICQSCIIDGSYLYVSTDNNNISKVNLSDGSITANWASGFNYPLGLAISGNFLYVANGSNISKVNLADGSINANWASGFNYPLGLAISGNFLYVANNSIFQVSLDDGSINATWDTGLSNPVGLAISGNFLYVANNNNSTISKIDLSSGNVIKADWAIGLNQPRGIVITNNKMFVTSAGNQSIILISPVNQIMVIDGITYTLNVNNSTASVTRGDQIITVANILSSVSFTGSPVSYPVTSISDNAFDGCSLLESVVVPASITSIGDSALEGTPQNITVYFQSVDEIPTLSDPFSIYPNRQGIASYLDTVTIGLNQLYEYFEYVVITCFLEGTKILTEEGYKKIEDLKVGDKVKTLLEGYKKIEIIGYKNMWNPALEERIRDQLYVYPKEKVEGVFEDLVITGCHSALIQRFKSNEEREKVRKLFGAIFITEDKARLPACLDERSEVYKKEGLHVVYNLALENDDNYNNYGICANGLLVESCSKRYLKELSGMSLKM